MIKQRFLLLLAACVSCSAQNAAVQDPATRAKLDEARQLLQQQRYDDALLITDALLEAVPDDRETRLVAAEGNLALFHSGRSGAELFLADAQRNLEIALEMDSNDPDSWLRLSYCRLKSSEFEAGRDAAAEAVRLLQEQNADAGEIGKALLSVADNQMQIFVASRRPELQAEARPSDDTVDLANQALATLAMARQAGAVGAAGLRSAQIYQWLHREMEALELLESAIRETPGDNTLHQAFQSVHFGMDLEVECLAAYKRMLRSMPGSTALQFYFGRAQVAYADSLRKKTQWEQATKVYADALQTYRTYDQKRPQDARVTGQWIAICELSLGRMSYEQGQLDDAREHYEAAFDQSALVAEYDESGLPKVYDSYGGNYLGGLDLIGRAIADSSGGDALRRSLEFYERIIERHPDKFGAIYNNAALSARDLGVRVAGGRATPGQDTGAEDPERQARMAQAMALWEKSYAYYRKAVELEPNDPRIVNDCALMLVYHLHRDYGLARELLDRALALGETQLAELPADADESRRNFLEEATGDAYQNIGVMLDQLGQPADEARPFLEKAVKFYPYQARQAARMLQQLERGAAAARRPDDSRKARFEAALAPARAKAAEQDWDAALLTLDGVSAEMRGYAPFHYYVGLYSLTYAATARAAGSSVALVDGLYNDAVRQLTRSVELDSEPVGPRLQLCKALAATGDFAAAVREAERLLSHIRSLGGPMDQTEVQEVHRVRAGAGARTYVAAKQGGGDDEAALFGARGSFRELERAGQLDTELRTLWATLEQWAGAGEQALSILARAVEREPGDQRLLGQLCELGARLGRSDVVISALGARTDATGLWYLGKAHFDLAQTQWAGGDAAAAIATLDHSKRLFEQSMATNADYGESCRQWVALSLGSRGIVQLSADDIAGAETSLLDALKVAPQVLTNDLGGGSTIKRGILLVGDRYLKADDLGKVEALYRAAGAALPDDVDFANNHGLFARDRAVEIHQENPRAAAELFEQSYAAYSRAARLDPDNIRLRNDRALLLVYHLERDLDTARDLLLSAATDGEQQLALDPPADAQALRDLAEAVGDVWGNLGYYYMTFPKDYPAAREALDKSLKFYPFERRAGTDQLRTLDGLEKNKDGGP